jgi:hypothetical protein
MAWQFPLVHAIVVACRVLRGVCASVMRPFAMTMFLALGNDRHLAP